MPPEPDPSLALRAALDDCRCHPGLRFLYLLRVDDGRGALDAIEDLRRGSLRGTPHLFDVVGLRLVLPNGSRLIFGPIRDEGDVERYLGGEYDGAAVEAAERLGAAVIDRIRTCIRTSKPGWRPRLVLMTGPAWSPPADLNPFFVMLRALRHAVEVMVAAGWSVAAIRADLVPRAERSLPDPGDPAKVSTDFIRSVLVRHIDAAIWRSLYLPEPEA